MMALNKIALNRSSEIIDVCLTCLVTLTLLRNLNLGLCYRITDVGVKSLASLMALNKIDLDGCSEIADECLTYLATLES